MDQATPAQTIGCQFVSQYYTVLHNSPKNLHRFYTDRSTLTYADVIPEGGSITQNLKTATGQKMIHETVMNMGYEYIMTDIYSVDSQYSKDGGVVVQVTGALQAKGGSKRPFVQTFFLAQQEKGYYVLNDIFRYLLPTGVTPSGGAAGEEGEGIAAASSGVEGLNLSPVVQDVVAAAAGSSDGEGPAAGAGTPSPASEKASAAGLEGKASPSEGEGDTAVEAAPAAAAAAPGAAAAEASESKKSAVEAAVEAALPPPPPPAPRGVPMQAVPFVPAPMPAPAAVAAAAAAAAAVAPRANGSVPAMASIVYGVPHGAMAVPMTVAGGVPVPIVAGAPRGYAPGTADDGSAAGSSRQGSPGAVDGGRRPPPPPPRDAARSDGTAASGSASTSPTEPAPIPEGVFIRDIPNAVTAEQLAEALSAFGPLAPGTLSLKVMRGRDSYAFVDFQTAEAASACLVAGMEFEGRRVRCEPKRPMIFRQATPPRMGGGQGQAMGQGMGGRGGYRTGPGGGGGGGRGGGMMQRGPPGPPPPPGPYPGMAYPGHPMMLIPQGMMPMQMAGGMMDGYHGMGAPPPPPAMGGRGGRGGGRYDGGRYDSGGRGRGGRGGAPPPPPLQQMPYS